MPAAAETFTSQDGVVSIELPCENCKQIEDVTQWITLSDGANQITIEHYSNGEKLPEFVNMDVFMHGATPESLWGTAEAMNQANEDSVEAPDIFETAMKNNFEVGKVIIDQIMTASINQ